MIFLIDADTPAVRSALSATRRIESSDGDWVTVGYHRSELFALFESEVAGWLAGARRACRSDGEVVLTFTPHGRNFRKELVDPSYKANRTLRARPLGTADIMEHALAGGFPWRAVAEPGLEADDLCGLLSDGDHCVVSIDKDLLQVPGRVWNPDKEAMTDVSPAFAERSHMYQTLVGDATDGYPGLPGMGPVRATRLLDQGPPWDEIAGLFPDEQSFLTQARLAKILRPGMYDFETKEVTLWNP